MNHTRAFSPKTIKQLNKKGISITGTQAAPAFEGDAYFSGVVYMLTYKDAAFLRTHSQVIILANSSWNPETDLI